MRIRNVAVVAYILAGAALASSAGAAEMLTNPGFENDFSNWGTYRPYGAANQLNISTWSGDQRTPASTKAAVMAMGYAQTPADGNYWNWLSHDWVPVTAGESYSASAWVMAKVLAGHSEAWIEVQFLNGGGDIVGQFQSSHITADQSFTLMQVTDAGNVSLPAPQNATWARMQAVVMQSSAETGTEWYVFDDFSMASVPEPSIGAAIAVCAAAVTLRRVRRQ